MRIVADENMPALTPFESQGQVTRVNGRTLTRNQLKDTEVLLVRSVTHVDRALLEGTPVRFVGSATIGTDHIDRQALDDLGIAFAHAPGCNARAVVEYVLQALLLACHKQGRSLRESRVGIVGLGNVGGRLADWLNALGVTVIGCDPPLARAGARTPVPLDPLDAALEADLLSLHVPLTRDGDDASHHLIDAERLARLGPEQTLISTCRGPVIDNRALATRLEQEDAPLALLDVWENEPRPDPALLDRVFLGSPHVAGYSVEGKWRGTAMLHQAWCRWRGESAPEMAPPTEGAELDAPVHDEADLLALLRRAYRLHEDDARLREAVRAPDPGVAFDTLRKNYPPRHELLYWRHRGDVAAPFKPLVSRLFAPE